MEIILLQRVAKLGNMGDVVKVKNGFARNFLFPQKKAVRLTEAAQAQFEENKAKLAQENANRKTVAEQLAKNLAGKVLIVIRQAGDSGQLYGSVSSRDIVTGLAAEGFSGVERHDVLIHKVIKELGLHPVTLHLHAEVSVDIRVNVALSREEAAAQLQSVDKKDSKKSMTSDDSYEEDMEASA